MTFLSIYNSIDSKNQFSLQVKEKYNKKSDWKPFPDLNFKGRIIQNQDSVEIKVSRTEYDKSKIGDTINIFRTTADGRYISQYEVNNQPMINIGDKNYSFVFIPSIVFILIGFFSILYYIKKYT